MSFVRQESKIMIDDEKDKEKIREIEKKQKKEENNDTGIVWYVGEPACC